MRRGRKYIWEYGRQFSVEHHPWQCGSFSEKSFVHVNTLSSCQVTRIGKIDSQLGEVV